MNGQFRLKTTQDKAIIILFTGKINSSKYLVYADPCVNQKICFAPLWIKIIKFVKGENHKI